MVQDGAGMRSAWWPLLFLWLAAHAVLLGLVLGVKFLTVKMMALLFLAGTALWLLWGRRRAASLPALPGVGNEARVLTPFWGG
jgi:hypothetical protein